MQKSYTKATESEKYLIIPENLNTDDHYRFRKLNQIIQEIVRGKKEKEIVFADIGCSNGHFMKYVKEHSPADIKFKFIGIDKFISEKCFDFDLRNEDIEEKINLPDNFADIVLSSEVIEHIRNTDTLVKEMKRIAKSDGDMIITTPNLASYFNRFLLLFGYQPYYTEVSEVESGFGLGIVYKVLGRPKYGNITAGHLRLFTVRALHELLEFYGLKVVKYYPVYFSFSRADNKRKFIIKIFFTLDKIISLVFPSLASSQIVHFKK